MLLFAAAMSLATGFLFGLFPAMHSTRPGVAVALKANAGQPSGGKAASRFRVTLATSQIALSMALLASAGLFTKSLLNISRVDLGIHAEKLLVFGVSPGMNGHAPQRTRQLLDAISTELSAFPGVAAVSSARVRIASGDASSSSFSVQGVVEDPEAGTSAFYNYVGPGFLRTLGIPLLAGREFSKGDVEGAPKVAIVNKAFLDLFKLDRGVGRYMHRVARGVGFDIQIVGVAADTVYDEVKDNPAPLVLLPEGQDPDLTATNIYVRTSGEEQDLLAAIPRLVREVDPTLPVANLRTMRAQVNENVSLDRFVTTMSAAFASLATLLAALGLYGVLAYTVTQRTREFGLRMALGADSTNVRRLVLRQVGLMTAVGAAIGLASALALGRAAESLLFKMNAHDPFVFAAAAALLVAVALFAGFIPAQRAARVDPMTALRYE
jgi:predicted permease